MGKTKKGESVYLDPKLFKNAPHLHMVGGSGKGKSMLYQHMIRNMVRTGQGSGLIDPHGSVYNGLVNWCEAKKILKTNKIVLFDPTEDDWVFGFNPLRLTSPELSYHVDWMIKSFAKVWGGENTDQTPLLERCLAAILWVLAEQDRSLLEARYLINPTNNSVRKYWASLIKDPDIKQQWKYFNTLPARSFQEEFSSTINRMNRFLRFPTIKSILGQIENTIDFKEIMDGGATLLINLSSTKGKLSREASRLLGTLIVNEFLMRSLEREEGSRPFYLFIDECPLFLTNDIPNILDECRKFGLNLILAHQRLEQLRRASDDIYSAVMSIRNKIIFGGIYADDAEILARDVFLGELDLEEPKEILFKPFTVGHEKIRLKSHSQSAGKADGEFRTAGFGDSHTDTNISGTAISEDITTITDTHSIGEGSFVIESKGESSTLSESETWGWVEAFQPILKWLPTQVYSLEEQIYKAMAALVKQPTQNAIIKLGDNRTKFVKIPDVKKVYSKEEWVCEFKNKCYQISNFAKPREIVVNQIEQRLITLEKEAYESKRPKEPKNWKEA